MTFNYFSIFGWLCICALPATARTIFVNQESLAENPDGLTWTSAFSGLQPALGMARSGDQIFVAQGVYRPGTAPEDTFQLVSGVSLLGGFQGNETSSAQRNISLNRTILSGDLNEDDVPGTINSEAGVFSLENRLDNSANIITGQRLAPTTMIDGFTISGGHADGERTGIFAGGAMRLVDSSITIQNCTFRNNYASSEGGAIAAFGRSQGEQMPLVVTNCLFEHNEASLDGVGNGGALRADSFLRTSVRRSIFRKNKAKNSGALKVSRLSEDERSEILECTFASNTASQGGGALNISQSEPTFLRNCSFLGNSAASRGGAILISSTVLVEMINVGFQGNQCWDRGGAVYALLCELSAINCSFQGNRARRGGGLFVSGATLELINSVIWNNAENPDGANVLGASILLDDSGNSEASARVTNCLIQNWDGASSELTVTAASSGNFDGTDLENDPRFISMIAPADAPTVGGNLSIQENSFLIDRGADSVNSARFDLGLNLREIEGIDLGAYEFQKLEFLWLRDDDGDGASFGMEQAIGTPPYFPENGLGKRLEIDPQRFLRFGVNPEASPRTQWSIVRSNDLADFEETIYGPSATPPTLPWIDPSPPASGRAFYRLVIGLAP